MNGGEPDNDVDEPATFDLLAILDAVQTMREAVRGVVAMFRSDGFDDESARVLATTTLTGYRYNTDEVTE